MSKNVLSVELTIVGSVLITYFGQNTVLDKEYSVSSIGTLKEKIFRSNFRNLFSVLLKDALYF